MVVQVFSPHSIGVGLVLVRKGLRGACAGKKSQDQLNAAFEHPEFELAPRFAQVLNSLFCCLLYSAGMPVLLWCAFFMLVVVYWCDKFVLLRGSSKPPQYDAACASAAVAALPWAACLHGLCAMGMFGYGGIFSEDE